MIWIQNCRITQDDVTHISNGSMYWWDIACTRGEAVRISSPLYFDRYVVDLKWYDSRLWDYIVLKHGEYRFVFGHTKSDLKVWDRIDSGVYIWNTTVSGISSGQHLHLELWKRWSNIKLSHLDWLPIEYSYRSPELLTQRGWSFWDEYKEDVKEISKPKDLSTLQQYLYNTCMNYEWAWEYSHWLHDGTNWERCYLIGSAQAAYETRWWTLSVWVTHNNIYGFRKSWWMYFDTKEESIDWFVWRYYTYDKTKNISTIVKHFTATQEHWNNYIQYVTNYFNTNRL